MAAAAVKSGPTETAVGIEEKLNKIFPPERAADAGYSDFEIQKISGLLQDLNKASWHLNPRLYIVLRLAGKLGDIDTFLSAGHTDIWFPYSDQNIPDKVRPATFARILKHQWMITTKDADLVKGKHCHLLKGELFKKHFNSKRFLGSGGFGQVQEVESRSSRESYALKWIHREKVAQAGMNCFTREVNTLRRAEHDHIVELVGSFIDPDFVGFIMKPVANCDFAAFLRASHEDQAKKSFLWTYFGCLTNALVYLHNTLYIRHKDLKPSNILVKDNKVILTDFELAHDWSESLQSTTAEEKYRTVKYCAPEGMNNTPRNTGSDIWSLGCIFLEMITILRGESIDAMALFFKETGSRHSDFRDNPGAVSGWIQHLERNKRSKLENMPLEWIRQMLDHHPLHRPTGRELRRWIWDAKSQTDEPTDSSITFYSICCERRQVPIKMTRGELHYAVGLQDESEVTRLLENGVDPNEVDNEGRTVLHMTAEEGQTSLVRLLLEHGVHINVDERDRDGRTPLHVAAEKGNIGAAEALINNGADVNVKESIFGYTPLHSAAWFGSEGIVRLLLNTEKTDLKAKTRADHTAQSLAELWPRVEIVRLLKEAVGPPGEFDGITGVNTNGNGHGRAQGASETLPAATGTGGVEGEATVQLEIGGSSDVNRSRAVQENLSTWNYLWHYWL